MNPHTPTQCPDCYRCEWRGDIPGDAHSACGNREAAVTGNEHGIANGWFRWPANFDPTWLTSCDGFRERRVTMNPHTPTLAQALAAVDAMYSAHVALASPAERERGIAAAMLLQREATEYLAQMHGEHGHCFSEVEVACERGAR